MKKSFISFLIVILAGVGGASVFTRCVSSDKVVLSEKAKADLKERKFYYENVTGIGYEEGVTRRDPSDVIRVGNKHYVYYTHTTENSGGYWGGSIYCAESTDGGHNWKEVGKVLGTGEEGSFDSFSVFTPNIILADGRYYLYYTGVCPTPGTENTFENNSTNDITAFGVAVSDSPTGPFKRVSSEPILCISDKEDDFDSYRIDDAVMMLKEGKYYLYYKGRSRVHGNKGPGRTQMGVAVADSPVGPFVKHGDPILSKSHEVMVWKGEEGGVFALASMTSSLEFASDGLDFMSSPLTIKKEHRPNAPGAYRSDLTDPSAHEGLTWGISMIHHKENPYLIRFEFRK